MNIAPRSLAALKATEPPKNGLAHEASQIIVRTQSSQRETYPEAFALILRTDTLRDLNTGVLSCKSDVCLLCNGSKPSGRSSNSG